MNLQYRLAHLEQQLQTSASAAAERQERITALAAMTGEMTDETLGRRVSSALRKGDENADRIVALLNRVADRADRESRRGIASWFRAVSRS